MGFVSPAQDYVEHRLDLNDLLIQNPTNTFRVDTPDGFVLVDSVARIKPGDMIAYQHLGYPMMGKMYTQAIITPDGEAIEGEALEDVIVLGKVTCEVLFMHDDTRPF
ncbi:phage repressor protein [Pantoea sp. LMR881]|uniref:phage repressor protein n=1 Tax=Pantoea sp. LMR881 TaxID=3014336 RepID=UPI0022AF5594|nr:phage repressor protein [Pantoea sp. LMR881]MCZ4058016.1 phage repressor protein [Pantoea sp. LMR881]